MSTTQQTPPTASGLERLVAYDRQIGYGLVGAGLLLAAIPVANVIQYRSNSLAFLAWGAFLSIFVVGVGLYATMPAAPDPDAQRRIERLRWVLMLAAGGAGALTALLGLILPFCTMPMTDTNYQEIFKGGPAEWRKREHVWPIVRCLASLIGGLLLMFVGLQLARPVQRTSMVMRRWLYGYNAVLSSLLLLFILILVNLLPYTGVKPFTWAMEPTDWTSDKLFTLHDATKNVLTSLKEPVKVYVLMQEGTALERQVQTLMNNCRGVNPQLTWEEISPDQNLFEFARLHDQYHLPERFGLLVVYGTPPSATHQFIDQKDLFSSSSTGERDRSFDFKGESALLNALTYLSSDKTKTVVYFTQGHGELDLNAQDRNRPDMGMGMLESELRNNNYSPQALNLGPKTTSIPEDAEILVIAGPREEFSADIVKMLREYLHGEHRKKKGKLVLLFDVSIRKGQMVHTGLEALAAEFGVKVNDNRLMNAAAASQMRTVNPLPTIGVTDPNSTTPVARAFASTDRSKTRFVFYDARTLESMGRPGGQYTVDNLIQSEGNGLWVETDLQANPTARAMELLRNPDKLRPLLLERPVTLAVTVTEGKSAAPQIPGHPPLPSTEGEPRLVVFGDASWISNNVLFQSMPDNFSLMSSCLAWLSGRHDVGEQLPASSRNLYRLKVTSDEGWRLVLLPGVLMFCGVIALGFGVWVVRRR
jgi:hypothetical protein